MTPGVGAAAAAAGAGEEPATEAAALPLSPTSAARLGVFNEQMLLAAAAHQAKQQARQQVQAVGQYPAAAGHLLQPGSPAQPGLAASLPVVEVPAGLPPVALTPRTAGAYPGMPPHTSGHSPLSALANAVSAAAAAAAAGSGPFSPVRQLSMGPAPALHQPMHAAALPAVHGHIAPPASSLWQAPGQDDMSPRSVRSSASLGAPGSEADSRRGVLAAPAAADSEFASAAAAAAVAGFSANGAPRAAERAGGPGIPTVLSFNHLESQAESVLGLGGATGAWDALGAGAHPPARREWGESGRDCARRQQDLQMPVHALGQLANAPCRARRQRAQHAVFGLLPHRRRGGGPVAQRLGCWGGCPGGWHAQGAGALGANPAGVSAAGGLSAAQARAADARAPGWQGPSLPCWLSRGDSRGRTSILLCLQQGPLQAGGELVGRASAQGCGSIRPWLAALPASCRPQPGDGDWALGEGEVSAAGTPAPTPHPVITPASYPNQASRALPPACQAASKPRVHAVCCRLAAAMRASAALGADPARCRTFPTAAGAPQPAAGGDLQKAQRGDLLLCILFPAGGAGGWGSCRCWCLQGR